MERASKSVARIDEVSLEEFIHHLCESGLLTREEIDLALAAIPAVPETPLPTVAAVAEQLINTGKLTAYQAKALVAGKVKELLLGNYEVLDRLGAGGMGTVFKARHRRMKRLVALKVLSRTLEQGENFVQRFQREVEVIARLNHPNIVMAFDADESDAGHFLVMEFVNGRDLSSHVSLRGPLPVPEAVNILLQAAKALEYAHQQAIVHRDIKPANLLLDVNGTVKVADLGLARVTAAESGLTQSGVIMGTVDYMAPEAAYGGKATDFRLDIYSLGCTFHYLLTGAPPYQAGNFMGVILLHQTSPIPRLAVSRPEVTPAVQAIFEKMMAKKPEERFQTMTEVVQALEKLTPADLGGAARASGIPRQLMAGGQDAGTKQLSTHVGNLAPTVDLPNVPEEAATSLPVLLVEPSRAQASLIRQMLQELDAGTVLVAPTGQKAVEAMRLARPRVIATALILHDMTGVELVRMVRTEPAGKDVGIILITSGSEAADLASLRHLAHVVRLPKPFDREQLAHALAEATAHEKANIAFPKPSSAR
jgi:CheY-like chemotaxis protein/tRNA A-37 threonylcarbamoyl transferase component Bud32